MARVLVTGGTGLVGSHLIKHLLDAGYEVVVLSRSKNSASGIPTFHWDLSRDKIDDKALTSVDYIIHLAGTNVGEKRWTDKRKQQIVESRVKSAELILKSLIRQNKKLKAFITASAVGYYGSITSDKIFKEEDASAQDFLGGVCKLWEESADKFQSLGIRTVKLRTGIVLTEKNGALSKMLGSLKFGIAAIVGSGKQYLPWIHIDDLCAIYLKAIEDVKMDGAYNAVAPEHLTFKDFIKKAAMLSKNHFLNIRIPSFLIKMMFGKMSVILLNGSRVSSDKLIQAAYKFKFPSIQSALKDLIHKNQ